MFKNFPPKYYIILTDSPEKEYYQNRVTAGLRIALTLLMEEFEVHILLIEEAARIAKKPDKTNPDSQRITEATEDDIHFTPFELLESVLAFGGSIATCRSSLKISNMTEEELIEGVEVVALHSAIMKIDEFDKALTF